jgi:hypothetical protein
VLNHGVPSYHPSGVSKMIIHQLYRICVIGLSICHRIIEVHAVSLESSLEGESSDTSVFGSMGLTRTGFPFIYLFTCRDGMHHVGYGALENKYNVRERMRLKP